MNNFFLKVSNLTLHTGGSVDEKNEKDVSHKFVVAFEVIAFYTLLDYENFYVKGRKTFFELFDIESTEIAKTFFSEEAVNSPFLFVFPRLGTISPWASKAQNILDNTFRGVIDRVERCQIFLFDLNDRNENLSSQNFRVLKEFLIKNKGFDPLIEDVVSNRLPTDIFIERAYRETCVIDSNVQAIKSMRKKWPCSHRYRGYYISDYYKGKGRK